MSKTHAALEAFKEGFNCSQAVLAAYAEGLGLAREQALRIATGFGGGMRQGETCGAVTGAFMVIGLKYGKARADDDAARDKTYALVKEFAARFKDRHGTVLCRELIGCDISTDEGLACAKERRVFQDLCPQFIRDAVIILEEIL